MPFITEDLWGKIAERDSLLMHANWPTYKAKNLADLASDSEIEWVINLIDQIRSIRAELNIPASLKIPLAIVNLEEGNLEAFNSNEVLIRRLGRISEILFDDAEKDSSVIVVVDGAEFALKVAEYVDLPAERQRLLRAIEKNKSELAKLTTKINNDKFISKAPRTLVEESRDRIVEVGNELNRLIDAQNRIMSIGK